MRLDRLSGSRARPYERRRYRPILALVAALATLTLLTWTVVLSTTGHSTPISCPSPAAATTGEVLDIDALDETAPVPADTIGTRVLNAGGQRGQANLVAAELADLGFGQAAPPDNDRLYPDGDMECLGQLRFGPGGAGAAATLALVLPCTELVRDARTDAGVDVVVGTEFRDVDPPRPVRDVLDELANPATGADDAAATDPNAVPAPLAVPTDVLAQARRGLC